MGWECVALGSEAHNKDDPVVSLVRVDERYGHE